MAGPVGSGVLSAIGLLLVCVITLLVLRYYLPLRTNPAYLIIPVYLAIAIPASIIPLVPVDLASTTGTDHLGGRGVWLPERVIAVAWRLSYWISFFLTWAILPLLGEYEDSGYREPKDRILYSLRSNGQYYAVVLACFILAGIYFFINAGFDAMSVKSLVMALAYAWGLILAIYLMGHGLVALPRRLIKNASISGRLRRLQAHAPRVHERLSEAVDDLAVYERQVAELQKRKTGSARDYEEWIEDLVELCALPEARVTSLPPHHASGTVPNVITDRYLADLTRRLKRARHKKLRFADEWDRLVRSATDTQSILDSQASKRLEFGSCPEPSFLDRMNLLTPYTRHLVHTQIVPIFRYFLGAILSLASVALIWSEVFHTADPKLSLVGLTVVHHPRSDRPKIGFGGQVIAALWISYMCVAALTSVAEVKIWGNRALVKRGTYAESACWYSALVCRLTIPLAYNFETLIQPSIVKETVFYEFFGRNINSTTLSTGFSRFFPIFLILPVAAALFNLYGKVQNAIGFGGNVMEEDEEGNPDGFGTGGWREGRALIERELHGSSARGLGLATRGNSPSPIRAPSPNPIASSSERLLGAEQTSAGGRREATTSASRTPARTIGSNAQRNDNDEEGGFFQDFAHRVRNTIDTTDRPAWMEFRKPKWMGGDDSGNASGAGGSGGASEGESGLARWFGGRSETGRLRL